MVGRLRLVVPHTVMLVAAGFLYWAATRIEGSTGGRIGPDVWPKAVIVIMALLCAYEVAKRLFFGARSDAQGVVAGLTHDPTTPAVEAEAETLPSHPGKLLAGIALVAGYVVLVPWLGFFLCTGIFLAAFPWAGGLRRPVLSAALGLAGSLLLVVVFMRVAYISLPLGEGPFRAVSLGLMRLLGVT